MFKAMLEADAEIFLNVAEFAEMINLDGIRLAAQMTVRTASASSNEKHQHVALHGDYVELHFKTAEYNEVRKRLPFQGELCTLNGKKYTVESSVDDLGIAKMTLKAYRMGQLR